MLKKIRLLALVLLIDAALMQGVVWAKDYITPKPKDKCPVCGMFVAKYPKWVAEIVFKDGSYVVFDGCKDMFKYYFNMEKYTKKKSRDDIAEIYVTEYYTLKIHIRFSGGFISPRHFEQFALTQLLKVVNKLVNRGITVFFHLDQNWTNMLSYFREFPNGNYLLHFDGTTDIFRAKEILGDRMCLMGDVPARLLKLGTPDDVEAYCMKLIDKLAIGSGFILSAG